MYITTWASAACVKSGKIYGTKNRKKFKKNLTSDTIYIIYYSNIPSELVVVYNI